jgi:hypothetical protein
LKLIAINLNKLLLMRYAEMKKNTSMTLVLTGLITGLIAGCATETDRSGSNSRGSATQGTIYELPGKKASPGSLDYRIVENTKAFFARLTRNQKSTNSV